MRTFVKDCFKILGYKIERFGSGAYTSETSKCRERLVKFCVGNGVDIGPGGDPICQNAVRIDLVNPYANCGINPVQLGGSCENLFWFQDGVLDYVYSSHVLEDFTNTDEILLEWLRVLKPQGRIILYCPDEQKFRKHCRDTGQHYNPNHKIDHFSFDYVLAKLKQIDPTGTLLHSKPEAELYSWDLVWQKGGR